MSEKLKDKANQNTIEFEKNHGSITFLKMAISSLNRLLVEKGLVTKEELRDSFEKQIRNFEEQHQSQLLKMIDGGRINVDALEKAALNEPTILEEILEFESVKEPEQFENIDDILLETLGENLNGKPE